jgi:uncharacterized protein (TIGR02452 family)
MNNRKQRAIIAQETLAILERGSYETRLGITVNLTDEINLAKTRSIHYTPDNFDEVFKERDLLLGNLPPARLEFSVTNETTLHAARRLIEIDGEHEILCLNFASAMNPGGGFLSGSQAQEESLARATGLYPCLAQMSEMYETNRQLNSPLFTDNMVYSPQVPVFRDDDDILLDSSYTVSIITAPAVRANAIEEQEDNISEEDRIEQVMFDRTEKILSIAAIHGYKVLVLGAWGCGVFGNNPDRVAKDFYHHLVKNTQLNKFFNKVVFAVLDRSIDESVINNFRQVFNG